VKSACFDYLSIEVGRLPGCCQLRVAEPRARDDYHGGGSERLGRASMGSYCTKINEGRSHDRNRPLSWVGDTGIEPVTSSV